MPLSLSSIHDEGALRRFKCFFGPRPCRRDSSQPCRYYGQEARQWRDVDRATRVIQARASDPSSLWSPTSCPAHPWPSKMLYGPSCVLLRRRGGEVPREGTVVYDDDETRRDGTFSVTWNITSAALAFASSFGRCVFAFLKRQCNIGFSDTLTKIDGHDTWVPVTSSPSLCSSPSRLPFFFPHPISQTTCPSCGAHFRYQH